MSRSLSALAIVTPQGPPPPRHLPRFRGAGRFAVATAMTIAIIAALLAALGADPIVAFESLFKGAVGTSFGLGQSIMLASVLVLTGLAAAIPFRAHMQNVGGEGQLYMGAVAGVATGLGLPPETPRWLMLAVLLASAMLAGALWGAIAGVLKVAAGANEVIVSLMLQFIAILFAQYATTDIWPSGLALQTRNLSEHALFPMLWAAGGVTLGAPVALVAAVAAWVLLSRSALGFQIRAVGFNTDACRLSGIAVGRVQVLSFVFGGAAAGLAGAVIVAGIYGGLIVGSAAGFGFLGIAVALVARLSPVWIVPSALVFAALTVGSNTLQVEAGIPAAIGNVLVGIFVLALLALKIVRLRYREAAE